MKTRLRPSLRRLRYAGLVWFDSYKPSASAIADWQARQSPPTPGGAAGEEPPRPKAAGEEGGAVARLLSAPPITEYKAASGTARKASSASSSGDASRVTDGAAPAEPQPSSTKAPAGAHPTGPELLAEIEQWLRAHPECTPTAFSKLALGRKAGLIELSRAANPRPKTIRRARAFMANPPAEAFTRQRRPRGSPRPPLRAPKPISRVEAKPERELDKIGLRRSARARRETTEKAKARIEQGLDPKSAKQASVRHAQYALEEQMALAAKLADPVEQAKAALRKRYTPVVSMAVYGGEPDRFMVGSRRDLTRAELLKMAERLAA